MDRLNIDDPLEKNQVFEANNIEEQEHLKKEQKWLKKEQDRLEKERERLEKKRKRAEEKRRIEEAEAEKKRQQALKGMKYLLTMSEKYSRFFKEKLVNASTVPAQKKNKNKVLGEINIYEPTAQDIDEAKPDKPNTGVEEKQIEVKQSIKYFNGGELRPYQLEGVTWMVILFENGLNGILADEMGLGKTIQVIALFCYLIEKEMPGPFLIVCPLSTLPNWENEFKRFAPEIPVVKFHGSEAERKTIYRHMNRKYKVGNYSTHPVVLTSYQIPIMEADFLKRFSWQYIVVDEGHRIKNHNTQLARILRELRSTNRLLLTGTPLQNNITELWALLNFLLPHIFKNMETFASLFDIEEIQDENKLLQQEEKNNIVSTIHKVLAPFMLRRLKKDVLTDLVPKKEIFVYCPLSPLQRDLYQYVLTKNLEKLRGNDEEEELDLDAPPKKRRCTLSKTYTELTEDDSFDSYDGSDPLTDIKKETKSILVRLTMMNRMIMFKKIVDHPYLVHFPLDPNCEKPTLLVDENLVKTSGKLMVLDALLPKLKERGHKVLLFSTLVMCLDLVEEFLIMRGYKYARLDGGYSLERRASEIDTFNNDPDVLVFLLSTRAGGLGLNLTGADTVIFYDRDWNPQADIQAQDRCHRIGQTKPVMVYTLVLKNTIDERVIEVGNMKRRLERIVIKDGKFKTINQDERGKLENELQELQTLLEQEKPMKNNCVFSNDELHKLLDRSDLYKQMEELTKSIKSV